MTSPVEKLRRIWSPDKEVIERFESLDPATELDSIIRDYLHRTIEQRGAVTLILADEYGNFIPNTGKLRWETVNHEPTPGKIGRREVTIWVEQERA